MALCATSSYYDVTEIATRILPNIVVLTIDPDRCFFNGFMYSLLNGFLSHQAWTTIFSLLWSAMSNRRHFKQLNSFCRFWSNTMRGLVFEDLAFSVQSTSYTSSLFFFFSFWGGGVCACMWMPYFNNFCMYTHVIVMLVKLKASTTHLVQEILPVLLLDNPLHFLPWCSS